MAFKKDYNDHAKPELCLQNGAAWYEAEAFRAVSQAIGRCIRHSRDWGAVLLIDERFAEPRTKALLPIWAQDLFQPPSLTFDAMLASLQAFITYAQQNGSAAKRSHVDISFEEPSKAGVFSLSTLATSQKRWRGAAPAYSRTNFEPKSYPDG